MTNIFTGVTTSLLGFAAAAMNVGRTVTLHNSPGSGGFERRTDGFLYDRNTGEQKNFDYRFTTVIAGAEGVGKRVLMRAFSNCRLPDRMSKPVVVETNSPSLQDRVKRVSMGAHDVQPNYKHVRTYYTQADGIFLVFDVNDRASWDDLQAEFFEIRRIKARYCDQSGHYANYKVIIVGNKIDKDTYVPDATLAVALGTHHTTFKNVIKDMHRHSKFQYEKTPGLLKLDGSILRNISSFILKPERKNGLTYNFCKNWAHEKGCHYHEVSAQPYLANENMSWNCDMLWYDMAKMLTDTYIELYPPHLQRRDELLLDFPTRRTDNAPPPPSNCLFDFGQDSQGRSAASVLFRSITDPFLRRFQ